MSPVLQNILSRLRIRPSEGPPAPALEQSEIECSFERVDGPPLPVYRRYRYSIKPGWKYFGPLSALDDLNRRGLLEPAEQAFLKRAAGVRTVAVPLDEIRETLQPYLSRHAELFLTTSIPDLGKRLLRPTAEEMEAELNAKIKKHRALFDELASLELLQHVQQPRVLEIGYTSGGLSVIAFERLGCEAHGIDNFFDDAVQETPRHEFIKRGLESNVHYHRGDITQRTAFDDESFDLIYSVSTIEHIHNLSAAFCEMRRLLKPGGLCVHHYDPFFHPAGAHSLGILDCPWGHVRLSAAQRKEYLLRYRPHEAAITQAWIDNALHPESTIAVVQRHLAAAGFDIRLWENRPIPDAWKDHLTEEVIQDASRHNPELTLDDLRTRNVRFVAQRPDTVTN